MIIKTTNLTLKPVSNENIPQLAALFVKPEINRWTKPIRGKNAKEIAELLKEYTTPEKSNYYAAVYKGEELIGFTSLECNYSNNCNNYLCPKDDYFYIDLYIDPQHHRKGYGSEAVLEGLMGYARKHPEIKKVKASIAGQNQQSFSLYHKLNHKAKELGIELQLVHGCTGFLWNNPTVRGLSYVAAGIATAGLYFYWRSYNNLGFTNTTANEQVDFAKPGL